MRSSLIMVHDPVAGLLIFLLAWVVPLFWLPPSPWEDSE